MIDRVGLLPNAAKNLFEIPRVKLCAAPMGVRKIEAGPKGEPTAVRRAAEYRSREADQPNPAAGQGLQAG